MTLPLEDNPHYITGGEGGGLRKATVNTVECISMCCCCSRALGVGSGRGGALLAFSLGSLWKLPGVFRQDCRRPLISPTASQERCTRHSHAETGRENILFECPEYID